MGKPEPRTRALIYARRSVIQQSSDLVSVDKQLYYCHVEAEKRGLRPDVYQDAKGHRSGRHEETRPEWTRLRKELAKPDVAALIVYELDRASRSVRDTADLIETCKRHGVAIVSIQDRVDTTISPDASALVAINMKAVVAQFESDKASERQKDRVKWLKREKVYWGNSPFGTKRVGKGTMARMVKHEPYCDAVVEGMRLFASGMSPRRVCEELNKRGFQHFERTKGPEKMPGPFRLGGVQTMLWNPLHYAGYIVVERHWHSKHSKVELEGDGSMLERYARAMGAERSDKIEPLIDDELANAVIARRFNARHKGRPVQHRLAMLTPIAFFNGQQLRSQHREGSWVYRTKGPGSATLDAERVDQELLDRLSGIVFPEPIRRAIREQLMARTGDDEQDRAATRLGALRVKLTRLGDLYADGYVTREELAKRGEALRDEIRAIEQEGAKPTAIDTLMDAIGSLGDALNRVSPPFCKRALHTLFARVDLAESGIVGLTPHPWARDAFGMLLSLYLRCPRQDLNPQHTP